MKLLNTKIIIAKNIKMDKSHTNVLDYSDTAMIELLTSDEHLVSQSDNYSFIRKKGTISTNFTYSQCLKANYIAFKNTDYSDKWFFGWIDDIEYKSDKCTEINYTIDSFTTFWNDINKIPTFVLREHLATADDIPGANTQPENVVLGPEQNVYGHFCGVSSFNYGYHLMATQPPSGSSSVGAKDGVFMGTYDVVCRYPTDTQTAGSLNLLLGEYSGGQEGAVMNIQIVPSIFFEELEIDENYEISPFDVLEKEYILESPLNAPTGYFSTIKNKKLLTYPYSKCVLIDGNGREVELAFEYFRHSDGNAHFNLIGRSCPMVELKLTPTNYEGLSDNYQYSLSISGLPTVAYATDYFKEWYANNYESMNNSLNTAGLNSLASIASGNSAVGVISNISTGLYSTIKSNENQINVASIQPAKQRGSYSNGTVDCSIPNKNDFYYCIVAQVPEYLNKIDKYFTMFGYATNTIKVPNYDNRSKFNYVQIAGSVGHGEIPSKYMEEISNILNTGVTIWHDHAVLGDYTVDNE